MAPPLAGREAKMTWSSDPPCAARSPAAASHCAAARRQRHHMHASGIMQNTLAACTAKSFVSSDYNVNRWRALGLVVGHIKP